MFRIIEPKDHCFYKEQINLLRELMRKQQGIEVYEEDSPHTTFFIEKSKNDIWMGGFLALREARNLPESIKRKFGCLYKPHQQVWYGAFFSQLKGEYFLESFSRTRRALSDIYRILYEDFYKSLYQELIDFGKKQKIRVITITLPPHDYLNIDEIRSWPFLSALTPGESLDGYFHGVLSVPQNLSQLSQGSPIEEVCRLNKELAS